MNPFQEISLILFCGEPVTPKEIAAYEKKYGQVVVISPEPVSAPGYADDTIVVRHQPKSGKVDALNTAIQKATCKYILWLENSEELISLPPLENGTFYAAQIEEVKPKNPVLNHQVRLFARPDAEDPLLEGYQIPEMYQAMKKQGLKMAEPRLHIQRRNSLFPIELIQQEIENSSQDTVMFDFWRGMLANEKKQFNKACRFFNQTLKNTSLPLWNKLASLNSLANAYLETHRLKRAKETAEESLELSNKHRAPYLIIYQCFHFWGDGAKKYQVLLDYYEKAKNNTDANWDVYLPDDQLAFLMAEISYREGWHEKAYQWYRQFYVLNDKGVSRYIIEKLLIYALELRQRDEAIAYFEELFGDDFSRQTEDQVVNMRETLALFTEKGYFNFACEVYGQLNTQRPDDTTVRNGLIRLLIKNDEIKKAQALL